MFLKIVSEKSKVGRDLGRGLDCKMEPSDRPCRVIRRFIGYIRQIISIHRKARRAERSDAFNYRRSFSARAAAVCASDIDSLARISRRIGAAI